MQEEIITQRKEKLKLLQDKGLDPFKFTQFPAQEIQEILTNFQENLEVQTAARVLSLRLHGRSAFLDLEDCTGRIQCYLRKDVFGEEKYNLFKDTVDIGDIIGVKGNLFKTHTGQITINVKELFILSKSLRPLPEKWHGLKDVEIRFRRRYVDLIANKNVRDIFIKRAYIIDYIRSFLHQRGYIELETPILQSIPGGARGNPFKTYHQALNRELYLRIAPELYLKRALVGGLRKVFEIGRNFRNEGLSSRHNPEFTMLEVYCAYTDYTYMMSLTEELISSLVKKMFGSLVIEYQNNKIDFSPPWRKISFAKILKERFNIEPVDTPQEIIRKLSSSGKIKGQNLTRSQVLNLVEEIVEEEVGWDPVFVIDYFISFSPLAKEKPENLSVAERFELFIGGIEIANAYSELNDPIEQRKRFASQVKEQENMEKIDEDFLMALEYGMPPASGLGIGVDRLVMILTNQTSIKEVILFPLLKDI